MNRKLSFSSNAEIQNRQMALFGDRILKGRTMIAQARKALADTAKATDNPTVSNILHENYRQLGKVLDLLNNTIDNIERRIK